MQTDRKFHAIFIKADGSDVCVSMKAVMHVLAKHQVKPRRGRWEIKLWMVDEMAAFDKEHGIPPSRPDVVEDVRRMDEGKPPIYSRSNDWKMIIDDPDDDGQRH